MPCERECTELVRCVDHHPGIEIDPIIQCFRTNVRDNISEIERVRATRYHKRREQERSEKKKGSEFKKMGKHVPKLYVEAKRWSRQIEGITFQIGHEMLGTWGLRCHMVMVENEYTMDVVYHNTILDNKESVADAIMWGESILRTLQYSQDFFRKGKET